MRSLLIHKDLYQATVVSRTKTETRRTHGLDEINKDSQRYYVADKDILYESKRLYVRFGDRLMSSKNPVVKSRYKLGETLYLAEPLWILRQEHLKANHTLLPSEVPHLYEYDMDEQQIKAAKELKLAGLWKKISPLLLSQEYGRQYIKITDIDIEPVQNITPAAVLREGISPPSTDLPPEAIIAMYATLFDRVNSPGAWNQRPFVFVYRYDYLPNFKRRLQQDVKA